MPSGQRQDQRAPCPVHNYLCPTQTPLALALRPSAHRHGALAVTFPHPAIKRPRLRRLPGSRRHARNLDEPVLPGSLRAARVRQERLRRPRPDRPGRSVPIVRRDPYRWLVVARTPAVRFTYTLFGDRATAPTRDRPHPRASQHACHLRLGTGAGGRGRGDPLHPPRRRLAGRDPAVPGADPWTGRAHLAYFMDSPTELVPSRFARTVSSQAANRHRETRIHTKGPMPRSTTPRVSGIVTKQVRVFGETARFDTGTYTFLADYLPWPTATAWSTATRRLSSVARWQRFAQPARHASHEFFHSWNMERIRAPSSSRSLHEEPVAHLWFGEGSPTTTTCAVRRAGHDPTRPSPRPVAEAVNAVLAAPAGASTARWT